MGKTISSQSPPDRSERDPFRFGWRYVRRPGRNGADEWEQVPLTPEDWLHPQEGDEIPENTTQERDRTYLADVLRLQSAGTAHRLVLSDCLIDWGVPGLRNHSPDLCVMDDVADLTRSWSTFRVAQERAKPVLAIEIVSVHDDAPRTRENDVAIKVEHYYRAGVPLYVIADQQEEGGPRSLVGYRRGRRAYVPMTPDEQGRLFIEPLRLFIGMRDERIVCFDATTGEEIPDLTGMAQARQQAEQARAAEAQARQQAEQERAAEAQARQQAEQARAAEAQARQQAEAALAAAQARIQELEAQAQQRRRRPPRGR